MAWNWYPPVPEGANKLPPRLHGHADMDVITLLYQRTGATAFILSVMAWHNLHRLAVARHYPLLARHPHLLTMTVACRGVECKLCDCHTAYESANSMHA